MEWQVLLFNTIPQISINPLTIRISQGLTAGCSAVGGMEWQVLLFNTIPQISINSLTLRISQGLTAGCSAVGGMEWQVLLFNTIHQISMNPLTLRMSPNFSLTANFREIIFTFKFLAPRSSQTIENVMDQQLLKILVLYRCHLKPLQ